MKLFMIIMLFGLLLEIVEFSNTYKHIRPRKFYHPRPWQPPFRWYPKPFKRFRKRIPHKPLYHSYERDYHRYAPFYNNYKDASDDDKPYIIVIQLPRRKEKYKSHQRLHAADPIEYSQDIDYIDNDDEYDDEELKVYQLDNKRAIKVNDRLSVLVS